MTNLNQKYGSYKVSEFVQGPRGYKIDESEVPATQKVKDKYIEQLEADSDIEYKRKFSLGEKKQNYKEEFRTASETLKDFSPFSWKKQMEYLKNLTPEEQETVNDSIQVFL